MNEFYFDPKDLKKKIKKKYKTMSSFARVAGIERYELQKMFSRKELTEAEKTRMEALIATTAPEGEPISAERLELLKSKIQENGGVSAFSATVLDENGEPVFSKRMLHYIYSGQMKLNEGLVKKLFEYFKI